MKVAFHTLGCKVNQYETEAMAEQFICSGYERVKEDEFADVYVINTCSVTSLADRKSRQYIRKMKRVNPDSVVAVTGCYAQISSNEVSDIDGVNLVIGMNEKHKIMEYVESYFVYKENVTHVIPREELEHYVETGAITSMESRTRAYIKIQEGCNRFCSYCIIPYARGKVRSRSVVDILREAQGLIDMGFKELILTGINTALYGADKDFSWSPQEDEAELKGVEIIIKRLNDLPGDFRIRLSSLEPTVINSQYVKGLLKYPKLCHHLHLSIQSGSNHVIEMMNRNYTRDDYLNIVAELKKEDKNYGITTDIIVGFPGESEEDFQDSIEMVKMVQFCRVHIFKYSKRPGTKAATMENQISPVIKKIRSEELAQAAHLGAQIFYESNAGTVRSVLFEEYSHSGSFLTGYSDNYIKTYVPITSCGQLPLDKFYKVKLEKEFEDGMLGTIV